MKVPVLILVAILLVSVALAGYGALMIAAA